MKLEVSQTADIDGRKFEVTEELGQDPDKNKKMLFWSNMAAIALFIIAAVLGYFAISWIHPPMCFGISIWSFVILIGGYIGYLFVHELLRGLAFIVFEGVGIKKLSYGVNIRQGTVYCVSKVPVKLRSVRASLVIPFFIVFVPLFVIGILKGDIVYILGSALALTVSASDFYYLWLLRKRKGSMFLLEDAPARSREEVSGYILKEEVSLDELEKK